MIEFHVWLTTCTCSYHIMSNDQLSGIQGQIDALNTDIANLETQEAELTTSVLNKKV